MNNKNEKITVEKFILTKVVKEGLNLEELPGKWSWKDSDPEDPVLGLPCRQLCLDSGSTFELNVCDKLTNFCKIQDITRVSIHLLIPKKKIPLVNKKIPYIEEHILAKEHILNHTRLDKKEGQLVIIYFLSGTTTALKEAISYLLEDRQDAQNVSAQQRVNQPDKEKLDKEKLIFSKQLFGKIKPHTINNWIKKGCKIEMHKQSTTLILDGIHNRSRKQIFNGLAAMRFTQSKHKIECHLLIPSYRVGYVLGKERAGLDHIEESCHIRAFMDNQNPLPEGYARLILRGNSIRSIAYAWQKVQKQLHDQWRALNASERSYDLIAKDGGQDVTERFGLPLEKLTMYSLGELHRIIKIINKNNKEAITFIGREKQYPYECLFKLKESKETVIDIKKKIKEALDKIKKEQKEEEDKSKGFQDETLDVAFPIWMFVIGKKGRNIRYLQKKWKVQLYFDGNNHKDVEELKKPRVLHIKGVQENIVAAKTFLEETHIPALEKVAKKKIARNEHQKAHWRLEL